MRQGNRRLRRRLKHFQDIGPQAQTSAEAANPAASIGATLAARRTPAVENGKWRSFLKKVWECHCSAASNAALPLRVWGPLPIAPGGMDGRGPIERAKRRVVCSLVHRSSSPCSRPLGENARVDQKKTCRFAFSSLQTLKTGS